MFPNEVPLSSAQPICRNGKSILITFFQSYFANFHPIICLLQLLIELPGSIQKEIVANSNLCQRVRSGMKIQQWGSFYWLSQLQWFLVGSFFWKGLKKCRKGGKVQALCAIPAWAFLLLLMTLSMLLKSECGTAKLSLPLFFLFSWCSRYVAFVEVINLNVLLVYLRCTMPSDVADFRPIRGREIISH